MVRKLTPVVPMLAICIFVCGCESKSTISPSGKVVKVGIIAPFTASDASKGKEGLSGVYTAMKLMPLLDNGDRVEIVVKDDMDDPERSVAALKEAVEVDGVAAILTFSGSAPVLAMGRVANHYQTPIIAALATHPDVVRTNNFISQVCFDNVFQGNVAALYVRDELLIDRVAVFDSQDNVYTGNMASIFAEKFISLGGEITDRISLPSGDADLSAMLKRVWDKQPELLYLPIAAKDVIRIVQKLEMMNWAPMLMASDGLVASVLSQSPEYLELIEGILVTDFYHHDSQKTPFGKRVRKAHNDRGTSYAAMGVEGFSILLQAMNHCDDPADKSCINRQIRATTDFEGILGKISIDSQGRADRPVVINSIKGGRLHHIVKVY